MAAKKVDPQKVAAAMQKDKLSVFHFMDLNNPVGFTHSLRMMGLTKSTIPDPNETSKIIARLVYRADVADLKKIVQNIPYNPQAKNFTVDPAVWAAMGLAPGDFNGMFKKYINQYV